MRASEYIHFMNRTDIGLGVSPPDRDYTHFTPWTKHKRQRYLYQCKLKGRTPVK